MHDVPLTAPGVPTWLSRLPGNQVLNITVHEKQLAMPRLAAGHDGLRIVHLSDLHMSGRITKPYFETVVEKVNATQPDIIAITGDIVERNHCIDWIPGHARPAPRPGGVYYVLGNHDKKVDVNRLKQALADAGLIHVGGTCHQVTVRDTPLILAGNELPWFGPAADMSRLARRTTPPACRCASCLAHSPDQFAWAQANDVDLILAGHNHGGQICLPSWVRSSRPACTASATPPALSATATRCSTSAAAPPASRRSAGTARLRLQS